MIHKLNLEKCANNFFLYKIAPFEKEDKLLTHIIDIEDYFGGLLIDKEVDKTGNPAGNDGQTGKEKKEKKV